MGGGYFSVVSFKFLSFCSASSSNKAIFLNKLSRSERTPLSSFSRPLYVASLTSCSSRVFSWSSLRCVRDWISWSFAVTSNSSSLILLSLSSMISCAFSTCSRYAPSFLRGQQHFEHSSWQTYLFEFVHIVESRGRVTCEEGEGGGAAVLIGIRV